MAHLINWGVLGTATIARVCVVPAIQKSGNGRVLALASRSAEKAAALAREHDIPRTYGSYAGLIADPDIDAVYIPLPNHLHRPWTLRALEAGKHVLCEKPLALDAGEAQEMADAARAASRLLMEAFMYRFHPRSRRIKQLVDEGRLGRISLIRTAFTFNLADEQNIRYNPAMGGGALLDTGCYGVSLARWLLGAEPVAVQAQASYHPGETNVRKLAPPGPPEGGEKQRIPPSGGLGGPKSAALPAGIDTNFVGTLQFANGALAVVEASFVAALQQTYSVVGDKAAIELPHDAFIPWEKDALFTLRGVEDEVGAVHTIPGANEYRLMVEQFAGAVLGHAPLPYDPQESVANMQVLDALRAAALDASRQ